MNFRFTIVETSLNRAEFRWKWLKFLQYSFGLAALLCLSILVLGMAMVRGWVASKSVASAWFIGLALVGLVAWIIIVIAIAARGTNRNWLAAALERVDPRLQDRLNTLLFLEPRRRDPKTESFALRIARQTQVVLSGKRSPSPFNASPALISLGTFVMLLSATVLVYRLYSPWERLTTRLVSAVPQAKNDPRPDLAMPATNSVEENRRWGEVRITDPGADLKVTKVDVVPLQIEAAANESLKNVDWFSAVNGGEEAPHELPPPGEPRYAVYQPTMYLDEMRLSDWDVLTYYARAATEKENSFASQVYFVEVRPFREDLLKLPGGADGQAYHCLNELSALIHRQQQIIRQTHQHLQNPPAQENLQQQDRKKLAEAEQDEGDSTRHLYAKMAAEMENKPIGEALDNLAKAGKSLDHATQKIQSNQVTEAQGGERSALSELIAARKMFQKAVTDHPDAFDSNPDEQPPHAADSGRKLNQMAEFRNEAKAAQDFLQKKLEQQKALEQQARSAPRNDLPRLGGEEQQLQQALDEFQQQHPQPFQGMQNPLDQAQQAMSHAAESLQKRTSDARTATHGATEQLQKLAQSIDNHAADQQLADAYKLKQLLDNEIQTLGQCSKPGGGGVPDAGVKKTAQDAQETINQLKKIAEQEPTRDAFGQPLRDALTGANKVDLDSRLNRLLQAQEAGEKQQRAGEAKDGLSKVSKAFTQSEPSTMQAARQTDSLKPSDQDSFSEGMSRLDSLIKQLEKEKQIPRQDQASQGKEALYNLQTGMRSQFGDNDRGNQILLHLDQMLKAQAPLEVADLKKLMDELQHFSVETSEHLARKEDKPEVTNIDPAKLPPAYRGRIQKYFQKLSEQ